MEKKCYCPDNYLEDNKTEECTICDEVCLTCEFFYDYCITCNTTYRADIPP